MRRRLTALALLLLGACRPEANTPESALVAAARAGRLDTMRALIAGSADVTGAVGTTGHRSSMPSTSGRTPPCACSSTPGLMRMSPWRRDDAAHVRRRLGETAIVEALLSRGADPHRQAANGVTALANAAGAGPVFDITDGPSLGSCNLDTVRALLRHSPDLRLPANLWSRAARFLGGSKECGQAYALIEARVASQAGASPR